MAGAADGWRSGADGDRREEEGGEGEGELARDSSWACTQLMSVRGVKSEGLSKGSRYKCIAASAFLLLLLIHSLDRDSTLTALTSS